MRLENGREVAQFSTLLNPGRPVDPDASRARWAIGSVYEFSFPSPHYLIKSRGHFMQ